MIIPHEPDYLPPVRDPFSILGRFLLLGIRNAGRGISIILEAFLWIPFCFRHIVEIFRQMFVMGIKSLGVTSTVALFTGMILALQGGLVLKEYGQEMRIGTVVAETICREMGPLMTALILAASVGSAIAAQLGTMAVSEEIAALDVMSINPVRYLVTPRLIAMMLMCPALTVYTNIIGIAGGGVIAYTQLDVSWDTYYDYALMYLDAKEILMGIFKAWFFSIIIIGVSCYQGLAARDGAEGVGRATRRAVVISFLMILISGYFITRFFYWNS